MKLTLLEKKQELEDVFSFVFQPPESINWQAGQYLSYRIPHQNPDNRGETRIFTISSAPYQKNIWLTTRYYFEKSSSFKKVLFKMKPGETVEAFNIRGHFVLEDIQRKVAFITGGIGITPVHSILLDLNKKKTIHDIILIYSNRNEQNVVFEETLETLKNENPGLKINYIFSPDRCNIQMLEAMIPDIPQRLFYLSGPITMVKSLQEVLARLQVNPENIKRDYFPGLD